MPMLPIYLTVAAMLAAMVLSWAWGAWKTRDGSLRVRHFAFSRKHLALLYERVPFYSRLPVELLEVMQDRIIQFMDGKKWRACGGLEEVTDEMKVVIAANACLLYLRRDGEPNVDHILGVHVYPARPQADGDAPPPPGSWPSSTVLMVWDQATGTALDLRDTLDTAAKEYARELDLSGQTSPAPLFHAAWAREMSRQWPGPSTPDAGAKSPPRSPAEFFVAATEAFFELPQRLLARQPELYAALRTFYKMDPSKWRPAR